MVDVFMALLSFRGFDTPSLPAQGEQRRSTYFNIGRDIPDSEMDKRLMSKETRYFMGRYYAGIQFMGAGLGAVLLGLILLK
jgi:hypothetical protein